MSEALSQAEQTADRVRAELLRTLEELERRREHLTDWRALFRANQPVLLAAGGVLAAAVLARVGYRLYERRRWGSHRNHLRLKAAERAWARPQDVARRERRSWAGTIVLAALGAFATTVASATGRRVVQQALDSGGTRAVRLPAPRRDRAVVH
jgi:hypothetical protein